MKFSTVGPDTYADGKTPVALSNYEIDMSAKANFTVTAKPVDPVLPNVKFDDFVKCDMRVCEILSCEKVQNSDKLLKFAGLKSVVAMVGSVRMIKLWNPDALAPEQDVEQAALDAALGEVGF